MHQSFSYQNANGYPLAEIHGRTYLIDTSTPYTLANKPLLLGGERIDVATEVMGLSVEQVSSAIQLPLDGVLGANITDRFVMRLRPEERLLSFDDYQDAMPIEVEIENLGGMPVMHQTLAGQRVKAALSIGGTLSWIKRDLVSGLEPVGRESDVMGYVGAVEAEVYELPVSIGSREHLLRFGVLPEPMETFLEMANVQAIIGGELIRHYAMSLDMREGELALEPVLH